jgi:hypothetical protein
VGCDGFLERRRSSVDGRKEDLLPDRPRERVPREEAWKKKSSRAECLKPFAAPDSQSSYCRRIGERERA